MLRLLHPLSVYRVCGWHSCRHRRLRTVFLIVVLATACRIAFIFPTDEPSVAEPGPFGCTSTASCMETFREQPEAYWQLADEDCAD